VVEAVALLTCSCLYNIGVLFTLIYALYQIISKGVVAHLLRSSWSICADPKGQCFHQAARRIGSIGWMKVFTDRSRD
jgi:hypothetical protein